MRTFTVPRYISRGCTALLAGTAAVTTHAQAADWTKHFRVGMQVTLNIEAEFSGGFCRVMDLRVNPFGMARVLNEPVRRLELVLEVLLAVDTSGNLAQRALAAQPCDDPNHCGDSPE